MPGLVTKLAQPFAARAARQAVNPSINLINATSLVPFAGLWELTMASREMVKRTLAPFQTFLSAVGLYFVICYALAVYARW